MRTRPDAISTIDIDGTEVNVDEQGFLVDPDDWTERVAEVVADGLGITLKDEHWRVIRFMREFLAEHGVAPDARFVFRLLDDPDIGDDHSRAGDSGRERFFELFPYGYVSQACRIAGMRQPRAWSTG